LSLYSDDNKYYSDLDYCLSNVPVCVKVSLVNVKFVCYEPPIPLQVPDQATDTSKYRHYMSLLLEPRSLLLLTDDLYKNYLHGIDTVTNDTIDSSVQNIHLCKAKLGETLTRSTRVSLTIRYVPKVLKAKLLFGKKI